MNDLETITPKAHFTALGLEISEDLTVEEWDEFAPHLGDAALAPGFAIGDWLIFGERFAPQRPLPGFENMPAKVPHERYEAALLATRLDISTLQNFAYVARNVPRSVRHELLSFEHHRAVARLHEEDQRQSIATTLAENDAGRRMSVRRLRRSIEVGRVVGIQELQADPADTGIVRFAANGVHMQPGGQMILRKGKSSPCCPLLARPLSPESEVCRQCDLPSYRSSSE